MRKTPLYQSHVALGAKMAPFAGFEMPVQYTGVVREHLAVRRQAGLFDVSHMGEIMVSGPKAVDLIQYVFCLLYTSPSPRDKRQSRMPSSA